MSKAPGTRARRRPAVAEADTHPARLTLRDIARLAGGVHPSTVSLALRNHPAIAEATRKRIQAVARKAGYRPDPLLAAFNTHRLAVLPQKGTPVIAWISDLASLNALDASPYHRALWSAAQAAAASMHCRLDTFFLGGTTLSGARLAGILEARGITSLVVAACAPHLPSLDLPWERYAAVRLESEGMGAPTHVIEADRFGAARTACRHLWAAGYRRIGLLTHAGRGIRSRDLHQSGYLEAHAEAGAPALPMLHLRQGMGGAQLLPWIDSARPEVLIVDDPAWSPSAAGLAGDDVHWVHLERLDDDHGAAGMTADLATLARRGIEHVVSSARTHDLGLARSVSRTLVTPSWSAGPSAPGPRRRLPEAPVPRRE